MLKKTLPLACLTALTFASGAFAQSRHCADRDRIVERLAAGYGETRQTVGIGSDNTLVEVFASLETGTWTIVVTTPGGPSCLVASGQAYQVMADAMPNTDSGA